MTKIAILGNIFGLSGYDRHTRELANALHRIGADVSIECNKPQMWERLVNDFELNACTKEFDPESVAVMVGQPQFWPLAISKKYEKFYGYCVWEGDRIPLYWLHNITDTRVDGILVPSEHSKEAILTVVKDNAAPLYDEIFEKIHVIPHGYDPAKFYPLNNTPDKFRFIANKGWSQGLHDRGGIQWLIKAFVEEFKRGEEVELRIKINSSYNAPDWTVEKEMGKLGIKKGQGALVLMCADNLDDAGLNRFYSEGTVFVTTSMADAFNIPCIEAMACGLPVCTTNYGGQTDFVNDKNGWLIDKGKLVNWSKELQYEETKWFKPNIATIKKVLRDIYDNKDQVNKKAMLAIETAQGYTWNKSAEKLVKVIKDDR